MALDAETDLNVADLARRVANLIRPGAVAEADYGAARVRVQFGEAVTGWLPWLTRRAGGDADWWAPEVGEQVLVISPSGDTAQGWVLPAGYSDAAPAPAATPEIDKRVYKDGTVDQYDRENHKRTLDLSEATGDVEVTNGPVTIAVSGSDVTVKAEGKVAVTAGTEASVVAPLIRLNDGEGVVTGASICHFTGAPHRDISKTVTAGK